MTTREAELGSTMEADGVGPPGKPARALWLLLVILAGLLIRCGLMARQGSLHMDEAAIARNILERSYADLASPLSYHQASPLLHLWATKASVQLLGTGEWQLRLPALLAGLASVVLFAVLARRLLPARAATLATGLFVILPAAVRYSTFNKAYIFDVTAAIVLLLTALAWRERPTWKRGLWLAFAGILMPWASFTAPMILGGIGIALMVETALLRRWHGLFVIAACSILWLGSFAAMWARMATTSASDPVLLNFWKNAFVPLVPRSGRDLGVMVYHALHLFETPFSIPTGHLRANLTPFLAGLMAVLCVCGMAGLWRRARTLALMLLFPIILAWIASSLRLYPFRTRFLLVFSPGLLLLATMGMESFGRWSMSQKNRVVALAAPAMLLLISLANTGMLFMPRSGTAQMRLMLRDLTRQVRPDDTIIVHDQSLLCFEFYRDFIPECRLENVTVIAGAPSTDIPDRIRDTDEAQGRSRVWYVFENEWTYYPDFFPDLGLWTALAERDGARESTHLSAGNTTATLFDFSGNHPGPMPDGQD